MVKFFCDEDNTWKLYQIEKHKLNIAHTNAFRIIHGLLICPILEIYTTFYTLFYNIFIFKKKHCYGFTDYESV